MGQLFGAAPFLQAPNSTSSYEPSTARATRSQVDIGAFGGQGIERDKVPARGIVTRMGGDAKAAPGAERLEPDPDQ